VRKRKASRALVGWNQAQQKAALTARWAVTMTKWHIRRVVARTRWQLVTFCGPAGGESVGVVDMIAVRKDHRKLVPGTKKGDVLQIILIQVKGGRAAMPTPEDARRLRVVAQQHRAANVLLATWTKGEAVRFFDMRRRNVDRVPGWNEVRDLNSVFR